MSKVLNLKAAEERTTPGVAGARVGRKSAQSSALAQGTQLIRVAAGHWQFSAPISTQSAQLVSEESKWHAFPVGLLHQGRTAHQTSYSVQ